MELVNRSLVARTSSWAELLPPQSSPPVDTLYIHQALRVAELPGKGRGILATAPIRAGTLITRERALASSPMPCDGLCTRCAVSFTRSATTCHRCGAQFCSHECRSEEERRRHWLDCSTTPFPIMVRVALRALLATPPHLRHLFHDPPTIELDAQLQETLEDEDAYASLLGSLPMHMTFAEASQVLGAIPLEGLDGKDEKRMRRFLTNLIAIISVNAFSLMAVTGGEGSGLRIPSWSERGIGIFPAASLFNHACITNAYWTMERGDVIQVRAVKDIAAGEEVVISYATNVTSQGTPARLAKLNFWRFTCECSQACGSKEWLEKEARYWGFSCLGECPGPANFQEVPVLYDERAITDSIPTWNESEPDLVNLRLSCRRCGLRRYLSEKETRDYLHLVQLTTTGTGVKVSQKELLRFAANLYPSNQHRILAQVMVAKRRCRIADFLDEECLADLERFLEGRLGLGGEERLQAGLDKLLVAVFIFSYAKHCDKAETRARQLHSEATRIFANHFGPASPFATQTLA